MLSTKLYLPFPWRPFLCNVLFFIDIKKILTETDVLHHQYILNNIIIKYMLG